MPLPPNPEVVRDRDVFVFSKAASFTVMIDSTMQMAGWQGGQGVKWADSPDSDTFVVTFSDGVPGGFLLWGSNESSDQFISYTQNQTKYQFATYCFGPWVFSTRTFEVYTLASRTGGGPLVAISYGAGEPLFFSLRGWFTNEDESGLGFVVGAVAQVPNLTLTNNYLTVAAQM